jgi:hypothetical protein
MGQALVLRRPDADRHDGRIEPEASPATCVASEHAPGAGRGVPHGRISRA